MLVADGTTNDTLIDGFRVHNGYNNDGGTSDGGHGGGLRLQGGHARVQNCTFVDNYSSNYGGGVYVDAGTPTFIDCLFYQNEAFSGSGLFHAGNLPIRMYNCNFMDNSTFEGTVHFEQSDGVLANCWFHGNYAGGSGGAIEADGVNRSVTIANCTIVGNSAGQAVGGVLARGGADVDMRNCILWDNEDQWSATVLERQFDTSGVGSIIVSAANTAQGAAGNPGLDPLFVNGNARVDGIVVDRRAFEFTLPDQTGDMNCDGVVSVGDIAGFVLALTNPAGYAAQYPTCDILNGDVNGNGVVSVTDIGPFVQLLTGN